MDNFKRRFKRNGPASSAHGPRWRSVALTNVKLFGEAGLVILEVIHNTRRTGDEAWSPVHCIWLDVTACGRSIKKWKLGLRL